MRSQEPDLFDVDLEERVREMLSEAVDCEVEFARDLLDGGLAGLSLRDMRQYIEFVADQRLVRLDIAPRRGRRAEAVGVARPRIYPEASGRQNKAGR